MPVQITLRESVMGQGYVVQFNNTSNKYLKIRVFYKDRTLRKSKKSLLELPPLGMTEKGWLQGWKFASGETITLLHEDYQTMFYKIP
ncbi:MAG: hypothetical protein V1746_07675 [bacterium]